LFGTFGVGTICLLELFASELFCSELFSSKLFRSELLRFQFLNDNRHYCLLSENVLLMPMRKKKRFSSNTCHFFEKLLFTKKAMGSNPPELNVRANNPKIVKNGKGLMLE